MAPQRPPHVPHTQAAYAGASSGNPTSASLSLALDGFIPPLELVDPAAPLLLPQPQEATEPSRPPSGTSGSSFAPEAADGRARPGQEGPELPQELSVVQEAVAQARRRQAWHSLPVRAGRGGRRRRRRRVGNAWQGGSWWGAEGPASARGEG